MPRSVGGSSRMRRVADRIREVAAHTLDREVKDPRLGFVTITEVRVTGDLQHATLYYTVLGDESAQQDTATALQRVTGLVRSEVGRAISLRLTPTIEFVQDSVPEDADRLESALRRARERDAELRRASEGASYAAGEDAYRPESADDRDADSDPR
ncbi:MAG: 30S ribosome-binding factor RbfA [Microbacteriaceae bacterium]|nr:30S ribosome-binding factor RbfA [Microbacteriaceae bacterium]